jgi:hypothetical protein
VLPTPKTFLRVVPSTELCAILDERETMYEPGTLSVALEQLFEKRRKTCPSSSRVWGPSWMLRRWWRSGPDVVR